MRTVRCLAPVAVWTVILAAGGILLGAAAVPKEPGAWPGWRGPNRDAISGETGLLKSWAAPPRLAWQARGLGAGFSSLAIAGGRIYTMGDLRDGQYVLALELDGGKLLWRTRIGSRWDDQYGGPRSTPTVDADRVYALGTDGDLVCLDAASGEVRWKKNLPRDFGGRMMSQWRFAESPLVDGEKLIVTPGGSSAGMVALHKMTGATIWEAKIPQFGTQGRDGAGYASAVVSEGAGVRQYVQLMGRGLVGVRASDGRYLWGYNHVANDVANISTPIVRGDYVFASTGYQTGAALLRLVSVGPNVRAEEVYFLPSRTLQNHHGGMVLVGDHIYAGHGHSRGFPICIEMASGRVVWGGDIRNDGSGSAAVLYADGHLYFRYQNGVMMLIEATPAGYREKGSFTIPGVSNPSWSHPVVFNGRLYLREQDSLYVYALK